MLGILVATAVPVLLLATVATGVVGSTVHDHDGGYHYVVTDMQGKAIADAGPWFVPGDITPLGFVVLPVVLFVGCCILLNRHGFRRVDGPEPAPMPRGALAVGMALVYSLVAVVSGVYLVAGGLPVVCTACTHPEWLDSSGALATAQMSSEALREGSSEFDAPKPSSDACLMGYGPVFSGFFQPHRATGIVGVEQVTCPAPFQAIADRRRAVYYGAGGALIAIGLLGAVAMGFLVQPKRLRPAPGPTARPPGPG